MEVISAEKTTFEVTWNRAILSNQCPGCSAVRGRKWLWRWHHPTFSFPFLFCV